MAKQINSPVAVSIERSGDVVTAYVTLNGDPVDAEVQWWTATPYRSAPGGVACAKYRDPAEFALSAIRLDPPRRYEVTARVSVDGDYLYSKTVEVEIP